MVKHWYQGGKHRYTTPACSLHSSRCVKCRNQLLLLWMSLENFKLAIISSHRETDFATWRKSLAEVTICNLIPKWALFSDIGISLIKLAFLLLDFFFVFSFLDHFSFSFNVFPFIGAPTFNSLSLQTARCRLTGPSRASPRFCIHFAL